MSTAVQNMSLLDISKGPKAGEKLKNAQVQRTSVGISNSSKVKIETIAISRLPFGSSVGVVSLVNMFVRMV